MRRRGAITADGWLIERRMIIEVDLIGMAVKIGADDLMPNVILPTFDANFHQRHGGRRNEFGASCRP